MSLIYNLPTYSKSSRQNLVLGTASLGGAWGKVDFRESIETIVYALEHGVARLDTAPAYNRAEEIIGKALSRYKGKRPFISTKVGKLQGMADDKGLNNYNLNVMEGSVMDSMRHLQCECLDLLLLHEPEKVPPEQIKEVVHFLVGLKKTGKAASLGFGGTPPKLYWPYMEKGVFDVVLGYNNLDISCFEGLFEGIPFMKQQNMQLYQGSVLHMGLLGNRLKQYRSERPEWVSEASLKNAVKMSRLAKMHNIRLSTLAHRFALSVQEIDWIVVGARNMAQLKNTLADFEEGPLEESIFNKVVAEYES